MGTLFQKITMLVKGGFTGAVSLPLEDIGHEEKMKNESDAHNAVSAKNKTLLQNPNYGLRRKEEK